MRFIPHAAMQSHWIFLALRVQGRAKAGSTLVPQIQSAHCTRGMMGSSRAAQQNLDRIPKWEAPKLSFYLHEFQSKSDHSAFITTPQGMNFFKTKTRTPPDIVRSLRDAIPKLENGAPGGETRRKVWNREVWFNCKG